MSRVPTAQRDTLLRAAQLFDQMIELVEPRAQEQQLMPAEPLANLLHRCEALMQTAQAEPVPVLLCLPGTPALDPEWWKVGTPGTDVLRIPFRADERELPAAEVLDGLKLSRARTGQQLFFVAPFDIDTGPAASAIRLHGMLVRHPWLAFLDAGLPAGHLEIFSRKVLEFLDQHSALPLVTLEQAGADPVAQMRFLLGSDAENMGAPAAEPVTAANDYLGGAAAYEKLCQQLGYAPDRVPVTGRASAIPRRPCLDDTPAAELPGTGLAQVFWFMKRVETLLEDNVLLERMRSMLTELDACLAAPDLPDAMDRATAALWPQDQATLRLLAAAHFVRSGDALQAMGLAAEALETGHAGIRQACALLYLELGHPMQALDALADGLSRPGVLGDKAKAALHKAIHGDTPPDSGQHGQALLIAELSARPPLPPHDGRKRLMIEIGTTRETVPGQGSTRQLAQLCADLDVDFITVDMDPANTRRAVRKFRRMGLPFTAITAKGEDYLASFGGLIDYIFLDAYDFDHGNHSEIRQERYEHYLGARINDAQCHQMHLDCAIALLDRLSPDGLICFDDTWQDSRGNWTAKGTTAMPYLLKHGFEVMEARNRATLLRRANR